MYVEDGKKMEVDKYAYLWAYSTELSQGDCSSVG